MISSLLLIAGWHNGNFLQHHYGVNILPHDYCSKKREKILTISNSEFCAGFPDSQNGQKANGLLDAGAACKALIRIIPYIYDYIKILR